MATVSCGFCAKRSTSSRDLTYDGETFRLNLCDPHAEQFAREMWSWLKVAKVVPTTNDLLLQRAEAARRTTAGTPGRSRAPQSDTAQLSPPQRAARLERVKERWSWTQHSLERLRERSELFGFSEDDILLALDCGTRYEQSEPNVYRVVRDPVAVIVNDLERRILTVMPLKSWDDTAKGA